MAEKRRNPSYDDLWSFSLGTRILWDLVPMVHPLDGVLVFKPNENSDIKLVVPFLLHHKLFDANHLGPLAAHLGSY